MRSEQQIRFTKLWTEVQPAVAMYVRAIVRDPHATSDIVQNTAVVLLRKFDEWDSSRDYLRWAMGIAKFELLAYHRNSGRDRLVFDESLLDALAESWPSVISEVDHEQSALQDCLETLSPKAREIVNLRYFGGLKVPKIAEQLGLTAGAIRIALMRIRHQLAGCVERRLQVHGGDA
ncbi:sigma-70 family RNA polymerase sigma factor [Roseiconus lacunae]|uniref:Sigma-70 family RNA polymerase sigma factor n=1 Tax=Roseiconus lacunae TaxID=2605694 RepID=A0ABT7PIZ4_9BACT|nr:sigma-70 family RNA polymerase sigma factor [Roseiconus lacunae]MDM4016468.1 sigma-70 family RNA polymerase sigma factor [Roseiconus lacunae]